MPVIAQRIEQMEESRILPKEYSRELSEARSRELSVELPKELVAELDACTEISSAGRKKLKQFLKHAGIQSVMEMDYPLRQEFEDYLIYDQGIRWTGGYMTAYDRVKQYSIRKQMETLAGRYQYRWEMNNTVLFIPYHPDQSLAMEFDFVRSRRNMVWDFTILCSQTVKNRYSQCSM